MSDTLSRRMAGITPFYVMELLQRARELEQQGRDVIHMEIGEPDFPTPAAVLAAAGRYLQTGQVKYTPAAGLPALREAIADFYRQRYGVSVPASRIFVTPGASGAFLLAFASSLNAGEGLMMADPSYPCNRNFARLFDVAPQAVPVGPASRYQLTAPLIADHWRRDTRGVLLASPSNPTGTLLSGPELAAAIGQTEALGGLFFSDEIYHGLVYGTQAATALAYSDRAFVINSFSKYFGMTGWRVGWLVAPEAYAPAVEKLAQNLFIATPTLSQHAALAAFSADNLGELENRRREFQRRRDFLYEQLPRLGFGLADCPAGAFYLYADCSAFGRDSFDLARELLETQAVAVTPGKDFGYNRQDNHIRFAYTASIDRMSAAINRMEQCLCR